ncbi:hypothetical protein F2P56_029364 [Juglans regia]|uniref:Uncharacterized protein LOC108986971 isoform X2 n=2 Tax=Juglans regia TaxID=51240 RepID=A0A2I4E7G8_JUGRE|nr:uncharacterized protein LOC108986971 isoform X2 [Juglans regia]KAF5448867.1 hypothetical protein F2P56_029364 [Juglans regia]
MNIVYIKPSQSTPSSSSLYCSLFETNMENDIVSMRTFDMDALKTNLPQKRGLSRYYSGKSRTFTCMADVRCLEDLKKPEHPEAKKRKKYSERKDINHSPCRRVSSSTQCATPYVN